MHQTRGEARVKQYWKAEKTETDLGKRKSMLENLTARASVSFEACKFLIHIPFHSFKISITLEFFLRTVS